MPTEFKIPMLTRNIVPNKGSKDFRGDGEGELFAP